jgi:TonB family protein
MKLELVFACLFVLATAIAAAAHADAQQPLQPVKPWLIDYDVAECHAERAYGNAADPITLAIRPSPTAETYELLVARRRPGPHFAEELEGSVDFGRGPIKAWLLRYGVKDPTLSIDKFRITAAEMAQARSASAATFHIKGGSDVSFALRAMPDLLAGLEKCTINLQQYWNMLPKDQHIIAAPAMGDVREAFTSEDYPDEAMQRNQEGSAQFMLFIDEKGAVAACQILKPSGAPALDGMGCQVIRQRAKFKPALDTSGKPVRSTVVTPPVTWIIDG